MTPDVASILGALWPAADNYRRRRAEVRAHEDLAYVDGALPKQRLDLFAPRGEGLAPVALFFHGGLWKTQDRKLVRWLSGLYSNVGVALAEAGVAVAVVSMRQDRYAHTEHDALAAIAWVRAHAREHALDADRLSLVGHSAGGALALRLAWDPERRAGPIRAAVSLCGVYDLPRLLAAEPPPLDRAAARRYFGTDEAMALASPERLLRADAVPALIVTATGDDPRLRAEHDALLRQARALGARVEERSLDGVGHMGVALEVGRRRDRVTPAMASLLLAQSLTLGLDDVPDPAAWLDNVMRPRRPSLDDARAAVEGAATGAEAWSKLDAAGLLPAAWRAPSTRCYASFVSCHACGGTGHGDHGGPCLACSRATIERGPTRDAPPSAAAAVAIASLGVEALTALEAIARRSAEALAPWGVTAPSRVCWCVVDARVWRRRGYQGVEPARHAAEACAANGRDTEPLVAAYERVLDARDESDVMAYGDALVDLENSVSWAEATRAGLTVTPSRGAAPGPAPIGAAFRDLPDPFEGRRAAWSRGCALDMVERDGTVVIVVPA